MIPSPGGLLEAATVGQECGSDGSVTGQSRPLVSKHISISQPPLALTRQPHNERSRLGVI